MKIVKPGFEILTPISWNGREELRYIEGIARVCYKSEDKMAVDGSSARKMLAALIKNGHHAMLEHSMLSIKFTVDRGVSHELVRHRIMSFAQESTRYCNYSKGQFGSEITVIQPCWLEEPGPEVTEATDWDVWKHEMEQAEKTYFQLLDWGWTPQQARCVLPNSLKTEIVMTGNYREWRHFFELRACDKHGVAHPQMHEVAVPALRAVQKCIPVIFDDLEPVKLV